MDSMETITFLAKGFGNNLLITFLAAIIPLLAGILFAVFAKMSKVADSIFSWLSLPLECICPLVLLVSLYFILAITFGSLLKLLFIILVFTICYLGYMPARYNRSRGLLYNILYNGLGLISALFKWSFIVSFIGQVDLLYASRYLMVSGIGGLLFLIIPLAVSVIFLFIIELARRFVKQFAK